jgi:hypothetical protein
MGRFPRPVGAIGSADDLKVGDRIWRVYGIWPPQMGGEFIVSRPAGPYNERPKNLRSPQDDEIVFDVRYAKSNLTAMEFASDGNMKPNHSHNDNYWFRTEAEALDAVRFLKDQWEAVPGLIAEDIQRREEDRRLYAYED